MTTPQLSIPPCAPPRPVPPRQLFQRLEEMGYKGQDDARRALCLTAYRHLRRFELITHRTCRPEELPPKSNLLLMGPTGCGKTFLVELLFGKLLMLPTVLIDITGFSETGYVGDSIRTVLTRMLMAAKDRPELARHGVVCLDEFDKLAGSHSNIRFDGAGTTKDVTGYGVQKELLKMIEGCTMDVPLGFTESIYTERTELDTREILFVASGAFSGFKGAARFTSEGSESIGFNRKPFRKEAIAYRLAEEESENIAAFQQYGFLPELIGRFGRIVAMPSLDRDTLHRILTESLLPRYVREFALEGIQLEIDDAVLDKIISDAIKRQIGARGLGSRLTSILENAAFSGFGGDSGTITVTMQKGRPTAIHKP